MMYVCVCVTTTYVYHAAIRQYPSSCATAQLLSPTPSTKSSIQASVAFLALMHCNTQRLRRGRDASRRGPQVQELGFQLLCHQIVAKVHQNLCKDFWWLEAQKISHLAMHSKTTQIERWHACPCHKMTVMAISCGL